MTLQVEGAPLGRCRAERILLGSSTPPGVAKRRRIHHTFMDGLTPFGRSSGSSEPAFRWNLRVGPGRKSLLGTVSGYNSFGARGSLIRRRCGLHPTKFA